MKKKWYLYRLFSPQTHPRKVDQGVLILSNRRLGSLTSLPYIFTTEERWRITKVIFNVITSWRLTWNINQSQHVHSSFCGSAIWVRIQIGDFMFRREEHRFLWNPSTKKLVSVGIKFNCVSGDILQCRRRCSCYSFNFYDWPVDKNKIDFDWKQFL